MTVNNESAAATAAAKKLAAPALRQGFKPVGLHAYRDASGRPWYWRIRCRHPISGEKWIRPMSQRNGKFLLGEPPIPESGKLLYRLPELLCADQSATCIIVEGEACADSLARVGIVSTTSGGADSCAAANWTALSGRMCIVWPDNDFAGTRYGEDVAFALSELGCNVRIIEVDRLGLPEKGDCVDWLAQNPNATSEQIFALPTRSYSLGDRYGSLELICASDVTCSPVRWIWPGWLAAGKLHILAGAPGTGKTTIALAIAAAVSAAAALPDGSSPPRGRVVIWSGEDGFEDTLAPRLKFAGADMSAVYFVGNVNGDGERRPFDPATDMAVLEQKIRALGGVSLLVIDPVVSAVSGDSHRNTEVRRALQPLVDLASNLGIAVLGISHFSKSSAGRDPIERVTGSIAFGALARLVMVTASANNDDENNSWRLLTRAKSNIGVDGGGFEYRLDRCEQDSLEAARIVWGTPLNGSARQLLARVETDPAEQSSAREDAKEWLIAQLASGRKATNEIKTAARDAEIAWRTVERAKAILNIQANRTGADGGWVWSMPPRTDNEGRQDRQENGVAKDGGLGGLGIEDGKAMGSTL